MGLVKSTQISALNVELYVRKLDRYYENRILKRVSQNEDNSTSTYNGFRRTLGIPGNEVADSLAASAINNPSIYINFTIPLIDGKRTPIRALNTVRSSEVTSRKHPGLEGFTSTRRTPEGCQEYVPAMRSTNAFSSC